MYFYVCTSIYACMDCLASSFSSVPASVHAFAFFLWTLLRHVTSASLRSFPPPLFSRLLRPTPLDFKRSRRCPRQNLLSQDLHVMISRAHQIFVLPRLALLSFSFLLSLGASILPFFSLHLQGFPPSPLLALFSAPPPRPQGERAVEGAQEKEEEAGENRLFQSRYLSLPLIRALS